MGKKKLSSGGFSNSNDHAIREKLTKNFDHEFANEPLTAKEKLNNKKTK